MQDRRFSHQRERIYAAVLNSHAHPTAEMVYQRLKPEMPRLSLGTVYRNLRQMAAGGRLVELSGPVARFDAVIAPHTHFRCTGCGAVLDLDLPYDRPGAGRPGGGAGLHSHGTQSLFYGALPAMRSKRRYKFIKLTERGKFLWN